MTLHSGTGVGGGLSPNSFIHVDGDARPVYLFGLIIRQSASGRLLIAPNCISGFSTDGTPFAKGHIMAVELGGWDNSYNIVPQYENWQGLGGGDWRDMEREIGNSSSVNTMIVRMTYDSTGDTHTVNKAKFQSGETLLHWEDKRIPTRFEVWSLASTDPGGYFSSTDADKLLKATAIINGLGTSGYDFTISRMPDIDRKHWRTRFVRGYVQKKFEEYKVARAIAAVVPQTTTKKGPGLTGVVKPTRSTRSSTAVVVKEMNLISWVRINKSALSTEIKTLPQVTAQWLPTEISTFDGAELDRMVFS